METSAGQQEDKRPNQAAPRIDFLKARAAALKAEQMQNMPVQVEERHKQTQAAKEALLLTNARSQRKSLK